MAKRRKITIIGTGRVGSAAAQWIIARDLADIVLMDADAGRALGTALDLQEATPILDADCIVYATSNPVDTADSDVIVIAAGSPRKPGMTRADLLAGNAKVVAEVVRGVARWSPDAVLVVVTNPLDAMTCVALRESGFPRERVLGMAGMLDASRYRTFLAMELGVSVEDVAGAVLGGHGDAMLPLTRLTSIGGAPLSAWLDEDRVAAVVERTRDAGIEIVNHLRTGSACYAPAAAVARMAEAVLKDKRRVIPASIRLDGEYGLHDVFLGVPVVLGAGGVRRIVEVDLNAEERRRLEESARVVRELLEELN